MEKQLNVCVNINSGYFDYNAHILIFAKHPVITVSNYLLYLHRSVFWDRSPFQIDFSSWNDIPNTTWADWLRHLLMSKASLWTFPLAATGGRGLSTLTYEGSSNSSRPPSLAPTRSRKKNTGTRPGTSLAMHIKWTFNQTQYDKTKHQRHKSETELCPSCASMTTFSCWTVNDRERWGRQADRQTDRHSPGRGGRGCLWMSFWPGCP